MNSFIQRHAANVMGVLSWFDRVHLRGTLRWLANTNGMSSFLFAAQVLLKDFKDYAIGVTDRVCEASERLAASQGRRVRALNPFSVDDAGLLAAASRGEFAINGFRNRDLRALLFPTSAGTADDKRRQSGAVTCRLRLLRADGLIA